MAEVGVRDMGVRSDVQASAQSRWHSMTQPSSIVLPPGPELQNGETCALMSRNILVVEDDATTAGLLCQILREAGCVVIGPACSTPIALQNIAQYAVDAALLDIRLG